MKVGFYVERASELRFVRRLIKGFEGYDCELISTDHKISEMNDFGISVRVLKNKFEALRYFLFLDLDLFISTAPYLGNSFFKRSIRKKTKYVHLIHSIKSLTKSYRQDAFKSFDILLLVGFHQYLELSQGREKNNQLLLPYGNEPIEELTEYVGKYKMNKVVVAPSWNGPLENIESLREIFTELEKFNQEVVFRPHEIFVQKNKSFLSEVKQKFPKISISNSNTSNSELMDAEYMISDVSGVAFEFALGLGRPVLFFEHGQHWYLQKNTNEAIVFELAMRKKVGEIFNETEIKDLKGKVEKIRNIIRNQRFYECQELMIYSSENQRQDTIARLVSVLESS